METTNLDTASVSKGVFVFKNNFKPPSKTKRKQKHAHNSKNVSFSSNPWYQTYFTLWQNIEEQIENLNNDMFSSVLSRLVKFVESSHDFEVEEIPTAALLTGINMPDHGAQFKSLSNQIKESVTPHVACLYSQDCQNIKYLIENMIGQFVNDDESSCDESSFDEDLLSDGTRIHLRKNQLNLSVLKCWYENLYQEESRISPKKQKTKIKKKHLVIIVSDFESFNAEVLQKFILIASCYIRVLPFVFIFGIATSISTLHTSLPYKVSSQICVKVFNSQPSIHYLNEILEKVFFPGHFQIGGEVFNLFMEIFLFYDLSVSNFIQNIKFAMAEHFSYGNAMALCSLDKQVVLSLLKEFSHEDLENVRHLLSFRKLVESETYENRIKLLTDDEYFQNVLMQKIVNIQKYIRRLHLFLKCLLILVEDLPKAPLGQQLRDLYSIATSKNITKTTEYKDCFKLLGFQSMGELRTKLSKLLDFLTGRIVLKNMKSNLKDFYDQLNGYVHSMDNFNMDEIEEAVIDIENNDESTVNNLDRKQFKQQLMGMTKLQNQPLNRYEKLREKIISTLSTVFEKYLVEPKSLYFHEIFFFDNISIQSYIIGSHRSAIHNALNNPQYYLQCDCCTIPNSSKIRLTMPDICIAYKLHLECGKMINLYDWLQAFLSIIDPIEIDDESKQTVEPEVQARFTQCVAELEYLGFIKSTKRKADHVTRLTWGG